MMGAIDWFIVGGYLAFAIAVGLVLRQRASSDIASYFVAGRNLPGWLIGTSMVATTFAADTPLAVTGLVAEHGIAGNWFWWSWAFSHLAAAFFFSKLWRRAEVITDAELVELRYDGRSAAILRGLRAFFFAVLVNCITMAWVIRGMGKIVGVLFPWETWLSPAVYEPMVRAWPSWISIRTPSEAISILLGVAFATTYAVLGGLPSVILTDLVQFGLAMTGAVLLAVFAVDAVGGLGGLVTSLEHTYGAQADQILAFFPSSESAWLPLQAVLVYLFVQWWAWQFADGGGILVQRMSAAKDEQNALRGTSWFVVAHYALRPWPWILVGLVALVLFPLGAHDALGNAALVAADREMAYPVLMAKLLPSGALGVMVAGMAAAFMSTIDTHINWGASYFVRDFYQRFWKPDATEHDLVRAGRWGTGLIVVIALAVTTQVGSISGAWKFLTAMSSGLGLATIARWLWWRINAASEIAGLVSAAVLALVIYVGPWGESLPYHQVLLIVVGGSSLAVIATTFLTRPVSTPKLEAFYARVRPFGFWGPVTGAQSHESHRELLRAVVAWLVAASGLFGMLFGAGDALLGSPVRGVAFALAGLAIFFGALVLAGAFRPTQPRKNT